MKLVGRKAWGAKPPKQTPTRLILSELRGSVIHYSAANADEQADHRNCAARVRAIQAFHQRSRGWNDIAYNWLVCRHGYVFVGRGFGIRSAAQGTNEGNAHYHAICFLGDDTAGRDDVTTVGRAAIAELVCSLISRAPQATELYGHSRFTSTECPGDELRRFLGRLRQAIGKA